MKILFIGDIVGKIGRETVCNHLEEIINDYGIDFVIANGENATHGKGLSKEHMLNLLECGVDVITLGNHAFAKKDIMQFIDDYEELLRPYNLHDVFPGKGTNIFKFEDKEIRVTNLLGKVFMNMEVKNPFDCLEEIVNNDHSDIHIIDFHAETTGEKMALANAFDGKVSAILGTHTHVATCDNRLLKLGTAYQSDVGMVGAIDSILGCKKEQVIKKTWTGYPCVFEVQDEGECIFSASLLEINDYTNKVTKIERISKKYA